MICRPNRSRRRRGGGRGRSRGWHPRSAERASVRELEVVVRNPGWTAATGPEPVPVLVEHVQADELEGVVAVRLRGRRSASATASSTPCSTWRSSRIAASTAADLRHEMIVAGSPSTRTVAPTSQRRSSSLARSATATGVEAVRTTDPADRHHELVGHASSPRSRARCAGLRGRSPSERPCAARATRPCPADHLADVVVGHVRSTTASSSSMRSTRTLSGSSTSPRAIQARSSQGAYSIPAALIRRATGSDS